MSRALLLQSDLPHKLWFEAVSTAVHLINRLPTRTLQRISPYQKLYSKKPDYSYFRTFGAPCFPWQANRHTSKFSPKAPLCIFVGYSLQYKGYQCYDPDLQRIITSRHVKFNEEHTPTTQHIHQHQPTTTIPSATHNPLLLLPLTKTPPIPLSQPLKSPPSLQLNTQIPITSPHIRPPTPPAVPAQSPLPTLPKPLLLPVHSTHPMQTRMKTGKLKPTQPFTLTTTTQPTESDPTHFK